MLGPGASAPLLLAASGPRALGIEGPWGVRGCAAGAWDPQPAHPSYQDGPEGLKGFRRYRV